MKNKFRILAFSALAFMASCTPAEQEKVQVREKLIDFKQIIEPVCEQVELPAIIDIRDWQLQDGLLLCQSDNTEHIFYRFRLSDFALVDSFITQGQGPGEFVFPAMARGKGDEWLALNRGKSQFVNMKGSEMVKTIPNKCFENIGKMKIYRYPLMGYQGYNPREVTWKLYDVETDRVKDSLLYVDESNKGAALSLHNYEWDFGADDRVVLAFRNRDEYVVAKLNADTIANVAIYKGGETPLADFGAYYTGVMCSDKYIFITSSKHNTGTIKSGGQTSEIEVYDYEGNAVCLMKFDYSISRALLDEKRERFIFASYSDDYIHILPIPDFLK